MRAYKLQCAKCGRDIERSSRRIYSVCLECKIKRQKGADKKRIKNIT